MALSSDSTCVNHLYSAQDGYETLHMAKEKSDSNLASAPASECVFPEWMQGKWEGLMVDGGRMSYRDERNFVTHSGRCIRQSSDPGRYVVHLETDCGAPSNYCALFKQRDANVMEFQLGKEGGMNMIMTFLFGAYSLSRAGKIRPSRPAAAARVRNTQ